LVLSGLLPERAVAAEAQTDSLAELRSAWTSTFIASLELGKQGNVELTHDAVFSTIFVCLAI
jgi:chromatin segregation and condensation protein Rec8/ScpA/Scc1 (kleisin family)